jgi:uncharacterized protein (DUF2384 family)
MIVPVAVLAFSGRTQAIVRVEELSSLVRLIANEGAIKASIGNSNHDVIDVVIIDVVVSTKKPGASKFNAVVLPRDALWRRKNFLVVIASYGSDSIVAAVVALTSRRAALYDLFETTFIPRSIFIEAPVITVPWHVVAFRRMMQQVVSAYKISGVIGDVTVKVAIKACISDPYDNVVNRIVVVVRLAFKFKIGSSNWVIKLMRRFHATSKLNESSPTRAQLRKYT